MSKIGVHVAKISKVLEKRNRKTYLDAIRDDVEQLNLGCVQIFVAGPASSRMASMKSGEIKKYYGAYNALGKSLTIYELW